MQALCSGEDRSEIDIGDLAFRRIKRRRKSSIVYWIPAIFGPYFRVIKIHVHGFELIVGNEQRSGSRQELKRRGNRKNIEFRHLSNERKIDLDPSEVQPVEKRVQGQ